METEETVPEKRKALYVYDRHLNRVNLGVDASPAIVFITLS